MNHLKCCAVSALLAFWSMNTCCGEGENVLYVYPLDGCKVDTPNGAITLQSADARQKTIEDLSSRVGRRLREKHPTKESESADNNSMPQDFALDTQYLSTVQIEVTKVPKGLTEDEMIELSQNLPCIEEVSKDGIKTSDFAPESDQNVRRLDPVEPSDPYLSKQWALLDEFEWGINAQSAWKDSTGGDFVVAVIDSGCDLLHPELQGNLWVNEGEMDCFNGIDDDRNGYIDDCYGWDWVDNDNNPSARSSGHGTGAAGIIASATNNAVGIAGICWFCKIMCLRFISGTEGKISNQVAAIDYAVKNGAMISNNSYGGYGVSSVERRAIERAKLFGHLFVTSAGNNSLDTDDPKNDHTPSVYAVDNILAVGASTKSGKKASFSNWGATSVDLFAPGASIQTVADGGRYAIVSGTSFAAPMAAGVAALIWSEYPNLNYTEMKEALVSTCKLSSKLSGMAVCSGILNTQGALEYARRLSDEVSVVASPAYTSLPSSSSVYYETPIEGNQVPLSYYDVGSSLYSIDQQPSYGIGFVSRLFGVEEMDDMFQDMASMAALDSWDGFRHTLESDNSASRNTENYEAKKTENVDDDQKGLLFRTSEPILSGLSDVLKGSVLENLWDGGRSAAGDSPASQVRRRLEERVQHSNPPEADSNVARGDVTGAVRNQRSTIKRLDFHKGRFDGMNSAAQRVVGSVGKFGSDSFGGRPLASVMSNFGN